MNSTEYIEKNFALEKAENQNYLGVLYHVESDTIIKFIKSLPTVEAVPIRHGKWMKHMKVVHHENFDSYTPWWQCSECGQCYDPTFANICNYCYYCGAKMERKEE